MKKAIKIGNRLIGFNHPPFIIAEMSGNHNRGGVTSDYLTFDNLTIFHGLKEMRLFSTGVFIIVIQEQQKMLDEQKETLEAMRQEMEMMKSAMNYGVKCLVYAYITNKGFCQSRFLTTWRQEGNSHEELMNQKGLYATLIQASDLSNSRV